MKLEVSHIKQYSNTFNKSLFKILSLSFFLSNFPVLSNASSIVSEIPDRYEILEGEFIGIEDSEENIIKNIEILGNTIQNENNLEDIKSVGDKVQGEELYEINILSKGKNLCDNIFKFGEIDDATGNDISHAYTGNTISQNYIPVVPASTVFVKVYDNTSTYARMFEYDSNFKVIKSYSISSTGQARITLDSNTRYVKFKYQGQQANIKVMLEESMSLSQYEPYQENKLTILSPVPLEKVGDIADKIIYKNGVWGVEKNIENIIIDETKSFTIWNDKSNSLYTTFVIARPSSVPALSNKVAISNKFNTGIITGDCEILNIGNNNIEFTLPNSIASTINELKSWIKNNNIIIKHKSIVPQFIPLPNSQQIKLSSFLNKTHIFSETKNIVNPTLKITVDRINKISREAVEKAENEPTIDNISIARMWVNQMDECILKDQLNERINQIYGITDLELEKKDITNNIDIYIKPQNILSMSLSTNNISFEDFNNTEDLEYSNAVEVTVNSSLPYQLNAYLESEIQNADKTKYINKSILNIKSSNKNEYRPFVDLVTPIVIEDDQEAGENNVHSIDIKLSGSSSYEVDVYKTTIKFEAKQK